jgi:hypothetical protein
MPLVAQYRQFAADYRRLAAMLTKPADKQALELFATGWDRIAENHEAMLRVRYFLRVAKGLNYRTLAICRTLALARGALAAAIAEKPAGRFMIRSRTRVVQRHPEGDGEAH